MSKPALARLSLGALSRSSLAPASQNEGRNMAEALDEQQRQRLQQKHDAALSQSSSPVASYRKTLHLHIGADLQIPLIKEEQEAAKKAARAMGKQVAELHVPQIPHVLPFTRWAAQSKVMQSTFVVDESKDRKKARLSWYHPDDTMVPRDWFRGGLLKDLAYYRPFSTDS
ncbi:hypothetical protein WJX75_006708 [Coccomyxa subellipsoidea]|uniref:Uncharacterized protein n=1 Tax=Coccomyxa subellipsoidea TaxID=248742 RepID=A0ABR2YJP9_9CHLO